MGRVRGSALENVGGVVREKLAEASQSKTKKRGKKIL